MPIDYSSDVGKVRLRIGDVNDLPFLPDGVIQNTVDEKGGNLPAAAQLCAQYILAQLAFKSHKKMAQMEVWSGEQFTQYRQFLMDTVTNPAFMSYTAVPYIVTDDGSPLKTFVEQWNKISDERTVDERITDITGYGDIERPGEV